MKRIKLLPSILSADFSCLKNDWIEPSKKKQKTFIKSFPRISKIHKLIKFKNYLNLVCPINKTYN